MAQDLHDDLEFVGDNGFDFEFVDDDSAGDGSLRSSAGSSSGGASHTGDQNTGGDGTTALEHKQGKDMQGIPWERLNYSRDRYRATRLENYRNYESLARPRQGPEKKERKGVGKDTFYDFQSNTRLVKPTIVHFQLRNLLWATSKHDVYVMQDYSVMHWSSVLHRGTEVLNVAGKIAPTQDVRGARPLSRVQISTMAVEGGLMVAGGFHGELICKYVDQPGVALCTSLTGAKNSITNAVEIYQSPTGTTRVMAANNDCVVRTFDTERYSLLGQFTYPWSVNSTSASPDGKLLAVLGDSSDCLIADSQSGKEIAKLRGHLDYSFSSAWHPDGRVLATGNQDRTCRLWDVRNTSESLAVIEGRIGAVRGLKFSPDGRFLAVSEPADFVHVYDAGAGLYAREQEIDLFGEIAGVSFSPDDGAEALFVAVADRTYGSLLEFRRRRRHDYLSCYL